MNTNNGVKWRRFIVPKKVEQINDYVFIDKSNKIKIGKLHKNGQDDIVIQKKKVNIILLEQLCETKKRFKCNVLIN